MKANYVSLLLFTLVMTLSAANSLAVTVNSTGVNQTIVDVTPFIHWWVDETSGTTMTDTEGSSQDATVSNSAVWNVDGKINGATYWNDLYSASFNPGQVCSVWSAAFWFKLDSFIANQRFIVRSANNNWNIFIQPTDGFSISWFAGASVSAFTFSFGTGNWIHLVTTNDAGNNMNMYMNGTISSTGELSGVGAALPSETMYLSRQFGSDSNRIDGFMDDIRIYCDELDQDQVDRIYNEGVGLQNNSAPYLFNATGPFNKVTFRSDCSDASMNISRTESDYVALSDSGFHIFPSKEIGFNLRVDLSACNWIEATISNVTVDSCSCPGSGDWIVDCSDNCEITADCDITTNNIIASGSGTFNLIGAIVRAFRLIFLSGCTSSLKESALFILG